MAARARNRGPLLGLIMLTAGVGPTAAQSDQDTQHATILAWADRTWLYVLDRKAVDGGRLNDLGWLQRFHPAIDDEYALDAISVVSGLSDEYAWHTAVQGARYWGGSINYRDLAAGFELKAGVPLGRGWGVGFRLDKEDRPGLRRNLPRFGVEKRWDVGAFAFGEATLVADKAEMDVSLGGGWRDTHGEARVSLTILDAFSQIIYQSLGVHRGVAPTALDYQKKPYAVRLGGRRRIGRHVRVEGDVGLGLPATVRAYDQLVPDSGFRQDERFGMAAGLVESTTFSRIRAGVTATWVRAVLDRTPLALSGPEDDFRLTERTSQVGGFVLFHPWRDWYLESWLVREHRPQTKVFRSGALADVDYQDQAWRGQTMVRYLAPFGLKGEAAFELDLRDVVRGDGQVPSFEGSVGRRNTRLRLEVGWRFGRRFWIEGGSRIDLDGDVGTGNASFDGAHARGTLFW